jgi:hypothetical protein
MPSPFPGMDPWLEDPRLWPDVHHEIISVMRGELNRGLRPRYHARLEERVYLSDDDDPGRKVIIPDIKIRTSKRRPLGPGGRGSAAVVEPIIAITLIDQEIREPYITLIDTTDRTVVTIIEVLSPTNKFPNSRGRVEYQYKRRQVMTSQTHFVEIDLLRGGERMARGRPSRTTSSTFRGLKNVPTGGSGSAHSRIRCLPLPSRCEGTTPISDSICRTFSMWPTNAADTISSSITGSRQILPRRAKPPRGLEGRCAAREKAMSDDSRIA